RTCRQRRYHVSESPAGTDSSGLPRPVVGDGMAGLHPRVALLALCGAESRCRATRTQPPVVHADVGAVRFTATGSGGCGDCVVANAVLGAVGMLDGAPEAGPVRAGGARSVAGRDCRI